MQLRVTGSRVYAATGGRRFDAREPAILFLHGAGQDHTAWQLPARYFAWHGFVVLAPDLPGHGRSEAPALKSITSVGRWVGELMDAVGLERAALVGHSMGAAAAVEAAAALGPRITRLALLGAGLSMPVNPALLNAALSDPPSAHLMIAAWGHAAQAKMGGSPAPGLWMVGGTLALLARTPPGVLHADLRACAAWASGREAASQVRCPALVMVGAQVMMTPPKAAEALARQLPDSRMARIGNCGHMLMAEAPDAILDALIGFLGPTRGSGKRP